MTATDDEIRTAIENALMDSEGEAVRDRVRDIHAAVEPLIAARTWVDAAIMVDQLIDSDDPLEVKKALVNARDVLHMRADALTEGESPIGSAESRQPGPVETRAQESVREQGMCGAMMREDDGRFTLCIWRQGERHGHSSPVVDFVREQGTE